jgi:hypothetical protein
MAGVQARFIHLPPPLQKNHTHTHTHTHKHKNRSLTDYYACTNFLDARLKVSFFFYFSWNCEIYRTERDRGAFVK